MKNIFKKVSVLVVVVIFAFVFVGKVNAADVDSCGHHKNYYFYSYIESKYYYQTSSRGIMTKGSTSDGWTVQNKTYFPGLPSNAEITSVNTGGIGKQISLGKTAANTTYNGSMSMTDFYDKYYLAVNSGTTESYYDSTASANATAKKYVTTDDDGNIIAYYTHGRWYEIDPAEGNVTGSDFIVNYNSLASSVLANASIIPNTKDTVTMTQNNGVLEANIERIFKNYTSELDDDDFFDTVWGNDTEATPSFLIPDLYLIEYDIPCDTYKATIRYVDESGKELSTSYSKTDLSDGAKDTVVSPTISGYTLKNTSESSVSYTINGGNFSKDVVYVKNGSTDKGSGNVTTNPKTGENFIWVFVVLAVVGLGYIYIYLKNRNKDEI